MSLFFTYETSRPFRSQFKFSCQQIFKKNISSILNTIKIPLLIINEAPSKSLDE